MKRVLLILAFLLMIISCNSPEKNPQFSEPQNITTKYTELKKIISTEVGDTFYVYIRVPKKYADKNDHYPVLYLLDGDIDFNMATSIVRYLQYGKEAPDLIIVGIGYGTMMDDSEQNFRKRDYTFTKIDKLEQSGGADKFLCFLSKELIPFIDKNYRTTEKRILNGYSLGGLFTIYASLKESNLFDSYIAGSPYIK
ncbi:MAG: alpha/beta hydrolase, partial [Ignavibacteriae bacterium]|nr:alpha/beta hydrolase [Ignavibacteriota bacterium]